MVIRLAEFDQKPDFHDDLEVVEHFRMWMRMQPGFRSGWHATDPSTGRTLSISVWDDHASLYAMRDRVFPGGSLGATPDRVTIFEQVEEF